MALALTRKEEETVVLLLEDGRRIEVMVAKTGCGKARLAIEAPKTIKILRGEVAGQFDRSNEIEASAA